MNFLTQSQAKQIDEIMMSEIIGYSLEQLMELAGLAVAKAVSKDCSINRRVIVIVGPGNNGGDALVAARHLSAWHFNVVVVIPVPCRTEVNVRLKELLEVFGVQILDFVPDLTSSDFIIDGIFGFSFNRSPRPPYDKIIEKLIAEQDHLTILSIDIPSGWDVEKGPKDSTFLRPRFVLSLTAPKKCMSPDVFERIGFAPEKHYVGGRFLPLIDRPSDSNPLRLIKDYIRNALLMDDGRICLWDQWGSESLCEIPTKSTKKEE